MLAYGNETLANLVKSSAICTSIFLIFSTAAYADVAELDIEDAKLLNQAYLANDPNLKFNQLWLKQADHSYSHKSGGAALGKLFRMVLRDWYEQNHRGGETIIINHHQNRFAENELVTDYNLRLSNDKINLKMEIKF